MITITRILSTLLFMAVLGMSPLFSQSAESPDALIWHWTSLEHSQYLIEAIVEIDGKQVITSVIPVCHHPRKLNCPEFGGNDIPFILNFKSRPGRTFRGVRKGELEGGLWQAGGEENGITFGIGLSSKKRIALNYMFQVPAQTTNTETVAPGFTVTTKWYKR